MSRKPLPPAAYADLAPILLTALQAGGGTYRPRGRDGHPSPETAIAWRARAYAYRTALRHHQAAINTIQGYIPQTPLDGMILRIDPRDPCAVTIGKGDPIGDLTDLDGKRLDILQQAVAPAHPDHEDPLVAEARRMAQDLGLDP